MFHKRIGIIHEIENRFGKYPALIALQEAEEQMIEWSHEQVKQLDEYNNQRENMERLFSSYNKFPKIREKLVDSAVKLIPSI